MCQGTFIGERSQTHGLQHNHPHPPIPNPLPLPSECSTSSQDLVLPTFCPETSRNKAASWQSQAVLGRAISFALGAERALSSPKALELLNTLPYLPSWRGRGTRHPPEPFPAWQEESCGREVISGLWPGDKLQPLPGQLRDREDYLYQCLLLPAPALLPQRDVCSLGESAKGSPCSHCSSPQP